MKVIVTRPLAEAQTWVAQLLAKGLDAIALPLIEIAAAKDSQVVADAVAVARDNASHYAAIMFVSSNAVRHFYMENQDVAGVNIAYSAINSIAKDEIYREFRAHYEALKSSWGGYDNWVKNANNASFGALAAYDDFVPAFEALFEKSNGDWLKFYAAVNDLSLIHI